MHSSNHSNAIGKSDSILWPFDISLIIFNTLPIHIDFCHYRSKLYELVWCVVYFYIIWFYKGRGLYHFDTHPFNIMGCASQWSLYSAVRYSITQGSKHNIIGIFECNYKNNDFDYKWISHASWTFYDIYHDHYVVIIILFLHPFNVRNTQMSITGREH